MPLLTAPQAIITDPLDQASRRQLLQLLLHILEKWAIDICLLADYVQFELFEQVPIKLHIRAIVVNFLKVSCVYCYLIAHLSL